MPTVLRATLVLALLTVSCASVETFPSTPLRVSGEISTFDTDGDGDGDYEERRDQAGRIVHLKAADWEADLDAIPYRECPHLVLVLDGVPYHLAREARDRGDLSLFHPTQRLAGVFPSMTDPSLATIFGAEPPGGIQSRFFSRGENEIVGGAANYLEKGNKTGFRFADYHTGTIDSVLLYLFPEWTLGREIDTFVEQFRESDDPVYVAYFGSTAGIGTVDGEEGIRRYLERFGRLARQLVMERRGRLKVTILADHGHTLTEPAVVDFEELLDEHGIDVADRIENEEDVVFTRLGLITVAAFVTARPKRIADILLTHPGVDLCAYPENGAITIRKGLATARVQERNGRYRYDDSQGDPLGIAEALQSCPRDADGYLDSRDVLLATADHEYPDPLHRIWRAFHGLVKNPPDLLASLHDDTVSGLETYSFLMGDIASTHGSLNRMNSTTFIMSSAKAFPEPMRLEDVRREIEAMTGRDLEPAGR